jgi:hypothetical protein
MAQEPGDATAELDHSTSGAPPANQVYYLKVGQGEWRGRFTFALTDWGAFRRDRIGLVNRFLALCFVATMRIAGWGAITSALRQVPDDGPAVRVRNHVRIHRFGVSLYVLDETYTLGADGSGVVVDARERFGPVPFLFRNRKHHTAQVFDGGMRAVYPLPLLGATWTAVYLVQADLRHIDSTLTSAWAEAHEQIGKVKEPTRPEGT